MAHIFTNGANLSGNHYSVSNTPTLHATTNITVTSGSEVYSAVFTAPGLTDTSIGCAFYIALTPYNSNPGPDIYVRLQEYDGVGSWSTVASATISIAYDKTGVNLRENINNTDAGWIYVDWDTPYLYTTVSAGYYRIALEHEAIGPGNSYRAAADSGAVNFAYLCVDDRVSAVGANDSLWVRSDLTIDQDITLGNAVTTFTRRTLSNPVNILNGGNIIGVSGNRTVTMEGNFVVCQYGEFGNGTAVNSADSLIFTFDMTGVTTNNIGILWDFYSLKDFSGASKTVYDDYDSGVGSTLNPLVVPSDWAVNDLIYIQANDAAGEQEYKYIKTKPSATTATLSDTAGGVESALSNNHDTDNKMINLTRNVKFTTNDSTKGFRMTDLSTCYEYNASARTLAYIEFEYPAENNLYHTVADYCAFHHGLDADYTLRLNGIRRLTHTNTCVVKNDYINNWSIGDAPFVFSSSSVFQLLYGWCVFDSKEGCVILDGIENELNGCFIGDGTDGPLVFSGGGNINCKIISTQFNNGDEYVFYFNQDIVNLKIINCLSGNILDSGVFIRNFSNTSNPPRYRDILIDNSLISDSNYWYGSGNENDTASGSIIKIHKYQQTDNKHFTYLPKGNIQSCGAGLDDTTTRTVGNLCMRFTPIDTEIGIIYEFKIPAPANSAVYWFGFFRENAAFYGDGGASVTTELFLPGSFTADSTCNFSASAANTWDICSVAANYTESISALATVRITVKSDTSAAYVYLADMYNGTNEITNLNTWFDALPAEIMFQDFQSPASVWSVLRSSANVAGSMGETMNDLNDKFPTNYIMGSSVQSDKDDEIDSIKSTVDTNLDTTVSSRAVAGDQMNLANDAITAAKFDETTAYPIKSDDSGSTQIARTGADADTLETLSDQLDAVPTAAEIDTELSTNHGFNSWEGDTATTIATSVWSSLFASNNTAGSFGFLLNQVLKIEKNRWKIESDQLIFYDNDGTTPIYTFDLKDENGDATSTSPYERVPV